jgi:hypothetical protein
MLAHRRQSESGVAHTVDAQSQARGIAILSEDAWQSVAAFVAGERGVRSCEPLIDLVSERDCMSAPATNELERDSLNVCVEEWSADARRAGAWSARRPSIASVHALTPVRTAT